VIESVEAEDFCCFEHMKLGLSDRGLVWLGGVNHDSEAADSNGSGKSTVFKALGWGLFGETIDKDNGDGVIRDGAKCATVCVGLAGGWTVVRTRRKAQPRIKLLRPGGKEFSGGKGEIQEHITELVGMDWDTFRNTILYGQGDHKRFLASKDGDRKDILHKILRTRRFASAHAITAERNRVAKRKSAAHLEKVRTLTARIEEHDLDDLKSRIDSWEEARQERVRRAKQKAREQTAEAKRIASEAPDTSSLETRLSTATTQHDAAKRLADQVEALGRDLDAAREALGDDRAAHHVERSKLEAARAALAKLEGAERCPVCNSKLAEGDAARHVGEIESTRDVLVASANALAGSVRESELKAAGIEERYDEAKRAEREMSRLGILKVRLKAELETAKATAKLSKAARDEARAALESAREIAGEDNPYSEHHARAKAKVDKFTAQKADEQGKADDIECDRAHLEFWVRGFGPAGLPSFVLDVVMPMLTERANHYLDALADGDIAMMFSTQRELKSAAGEYRDEISVTWEIEGASGHPPSGGQSKKMEIATDLALMDLAAGESRPDLLLLDEVFDGLDAEGRTRVAKLLHNLRSVRRTIFVVSHDIGVRELFERSVVAVKHGGVSMLVDETSSKS